MISASIAMLLTTYVAVDLSPATMSRIRAERADALNNLVLQVEVVLTNAPQAEPLAASQWAPGLSQFHRVTIANAAVLDELLEGADGRVIASNTIREGTIVRKSSVLEPDGSTRYSVTSQPKWSDYHGAAGYALLQWLDVHMGDAPQAWTSVGGLLASGQAKLEKSDADEATYSATAEGPDLRQRYEFTLNAHGTPRMERTQYEYLRNGKAFGGAVYEQHVLETTSIGGFELPTRTVFVSRNPSVENVPTMKGLAGIAEVRVTSWRIDASLAAADVGDRVQRKSSVVIEADEKGNRTRTKYDETGRVVALNTRDPRENRHARSDALAWRRNILLPGLILLAVAATGGFFAFTRRSA